MVYSWNARSMKPVSTLPLTKSEWRKIRQQHSKRLEDLDDKPARLEYFERRMSNVKVMPLANGKVEVISKMIPVYHISQTKPGNFRERTRAIIRYGNVFWRPSQASNYIKKNLEPDNFVS